MARIQYSREDTIRALAQRLKRNQLSADDFQRELKALSREDRASLVQFLSEMDKGPVEVNSARAPKGGDSQPAFA